MEQKRKVNGSHSLVNRFLFKSLSRVCLLGPLGVSCAHADILLEEDFSDGDGNFTESSEGATPTPFIYQSATESWTLEGDAEGPSTSYLTTPGITVTGPEELQITLDHRYSIELDWDGCGLSYSVNGGSFTRIGEDAFTENGYRDFALEGNHVLGGLSAFNGESAGYDIPEFITSVARIPGVETNDVVRLRFVGAFDEFVRGPGFPNWEIGRVVVENLTDEDGDGMPDSFEDANGLNRSLDDADDDEDGDDLTNLDEYLRGTDPQDPDSDGDGLSDKVETNTGTFVSLDDTGSDPNQPDSDGDGLSDAVETGSGTFVSASDTGTDPNLTDTDADGISDGAEVSAGTDPNDSNDPAVFFVDFNSTNQQDGPNSAGGFYRDYNAGHEVETDFVTREYEVFGSTVTLTPTWPDSSDNRVQQMIDRAAGNDANWTGTDLELVTDFLGTDTRTANRGNGDYDGENGTPTTLDLTLGALPGGTYQWTSFHHDTENVHTPFLVDLSTDGGTTFERVGDFQMSSSSPGGNPANPNTETGPDPTSLPSTVVREFTTDGSDDVVFRFIPLAQTAVHTQIFGINGFQLIRTSASFNSLVITALVRDQETGEVELTWTSGPDQTYTIRYSDNLEGDPLDWIELDDGYASQGETTSFTDPGPTPARRFYVVEEN